MTGLTKRELDVVRLVSIGLTNKMVATQLGLREGTVKIHLHNIYRKLNIPNRATLALMCAKQRMHDRLIETFAIAPAASQSSPQSASPHPW